MSLSVFWSSWTLPDLASVQWPSPRPRLVNACTKNKGNLLLHLLPLFMASIYEIVIPYELVLHFLNPSHHSLSEKCSDIKIWVSLLSHAWKRRCLDLDRTDQAHVGNMARLGQIMPPVPLCPCVNYIEKLPPSFVFACLKYLVYLMLDLPDNNPVAERWRMQRHAYSTPQMWDQSRVK